MYDETLPERLSELLRLAREAGAILLSDRARGVGGVQTKSDGSPVTGADLKADAYVRAGLQRIAGNIPIISEESPVPAFSVRSSWKEFWLVDALDGTKEYIAGRDEYTVNVALIRDGVPRLGVVYAPALRLLYYAQESAGSWKISGDAVNAPVRIFSSPPSAGKALGIVESRSHPSSELDAFLRPLNVGERIKIGSSLKFCLVAEGSADVYPRFGPTMEWDVAAGDCIFRYSGRAASRKSPLQYNKSQLRNDSFVIGLD